MNERPIVHITVKGQENGTEITRVFALEADCIKYIENRLRRTLKVRKEQSTWGAADEQYSQGIENLIVEEGGRLDSFDDRPALILVSGNCSREEYYRDGTRHRDGGPASIERTTQDIAGKIKEEEDIYFTDGKIHREDGPAVIRRDGSGITEERYYRAGKLHREGGPACITYHKDGSRTEEYHEHGHLHRADGPARLRRRKSKLIWKEYYFEGQDYRSKNEYDRRVRNGRPPFAKHLSFGSAMFRP